MATLTLLLAPRLNYHSRVNGRSVQYLMFHSLFLSNFACPGMRACRLRAHSGARARRRGMAWGARVCKGISAAPPSTKLT